MSPFAADLDLVVFPRKHVVKVIGDSKDGKPIAEDEVIPNEAREAFRIWISEPGRGAALAGPVRLVADLAVPGDEEAEKVESLVNDRRAVTILPGALRAAVDVPKSADLGFPRVVATLDEWSIDRGRARLERARSISPRRTSRRSSSTRPVLAKGRLVTGREKESFEGLEDGVLQDLDGSEVVTVLPLSPGSASTPPGSMEESIVEAQKAAVELLKDVMTMRDRSFLVTFENEPELVAYFTTDRDKLAEALAGLRAQGSMALWDAIVYGLDQSQGTKGREAYAILTDGEDRCSALHGRCRARLREEDGRRGLLHRPEDRIDAARRAAQAQLSLARETGGDR